MIIDHLGGVPKGFVLSTAEIGKICDRHFGVGCDQLLWLKPLVGGASADSVSDEGAPIMAVVTIFNADGSRSEMCGNGMRAIGIHLARRGPKPGLKQYSIRTDAGAESRTVAIDLGGEFPEVALGVPRVVSENESVSAFGVFSRVEIGNPHAVFFRSEKEVREIELARAGPGIETSALFPNRTNVEFAAVLSRRKILVRVWERGAGATLACGSGACAVVAAAAAKGLVDSGEKIEVVLPGGSVFARLAEGWREGRGQALLSGPAEDVYRGEWGGV